MMSFNIPANETPEQARQRSAAGQAPAMQQMPTNFGSGIQAVAEALMAREQQQQSQFPVAPGGAQPSGMTRLQNMFGLGGGLY
jgi:hypothetical protein